MKLFLDTEFTRLHRDARLISIALVAESGEEFYVELGDGYGAEDCSEFVISTVLPQLDSNCRCSTSEARTLLSGYLAQFSVDLEVCSDAPGWDWPFFCQLASVGGGWPGNVQTQPTNLSDLFAYTELTADLEMLLTDPPHHALADAKLMRDVFLHIEASQ